jgi:hypothetical protein
MELLGVRAHECVVNHQLEGSGCGVTGVERVFSFLALCIFLHVNCG